MKQSLVLLFASASFTLSGPALAQQKAGNETQGATVQTSPGKATVTQTRRAVATIEAIDAQKREVTLKGPKGKVFPVTAGPDVRNFDQMKVGDRVAVEYQEALSLTLKKDGKELPGATAATAGGRSAAGERPGGVAVDQLTVTADVIAVDNAKQLVTLRGAKHTVDLQVRDPEQLKLIKVGDQITAVYTQALAVKVEPAPAKKK
jgi:hypothetical protein